MCSESSHQSAPAYTVPPYPIWREGTMQVKGLKTGVSIALVGILAGGGGAYAAGQITSAQIKDGTITTKDIKKGTISTANLSAAAKKGMTGPAGPAGATGPAGARGPAGPKGDPAPNVLGSPGA